MPGKSIHMQKLSSYKGEGKGPAACLTTAEPLRFRLRRTALLNGDPCPFEALPATTPQVPPSTTPELGQRLRSNPGSLPDWFAACRENKSQIPEVKINPRFMEPFYPLNPHHLRPNQRSGAKLGPRSLPWDGPYTTFTTSSTIREGYSKST